MSRQGYFCTAMEIMPMACAFISDTYECIGQNRECVALYGFAGNEDKMKRIFDLAPQYQADGRLSVEKSLEYVKRAFEGESGRVRFEWILSTSEGLQVPAEVTLIRMDTGGNYVCAAFINDLRELKEAMASLDKISTLAFKDSLTGLYNRRYFMDRLNFEFRIFGSSQKSISVIIYDLDKFKNVNDTYGHPVGDEVLQQVSNRVKTVLRARDLLARYGGEEFIVMLLDTSADEAFRLAERLRDSVCAAPIPYNGNEINISISLGVATKTLPQTTMEKLIESADKALYKAKNNGRNRTEACSGEL